MNLNPKQIIQSKKLVKVSESIRHFHLVEKSKRKSKNESHWKLEVKFIEVNGIPIY